MISHITEKSCMLLLIFLYIFIFVVLSNRATNFQHLHMYKLGNLETTKGKRCKQSNSKHLLQVTQAKLNACRPARFEAVCVRRSVLINSEIGTDLGHCLQTVYISYSYHCCTFLIL